MNARKRRTIKVVKGAAGRPKKIYTSKLAKKALRDMKHDWR